MTGSYNHCKNVAVAAYVYATCVRVLSVRARAHIFTRRVKCSRINHKSSPRSTRTIIYSLRGHANGFSAITPAGSEM